MTKEVSQGAGVGVKINSVPQFYDLHTDPKEMYPMDARILEDLWFAFRCLKFLRSISVP